MQEELIKDDMALSGVITRGCGGMQSIEEATSQFCWLFERPNVNYAHYERRISAAHAYYEMYKDFDASVVTP